MHYVCVMNEDNFRAQMKKGILELCVLKIVQFEECYASNISERLKKADLLVVEGTLYPLLTRMKNAEWIQYRWEESKSGPPRKYYQITLEGTKILSKLEKEWDALVLSIQSLNQNS
jgi:PadR family transcriptional regulator, regulatory protein PadR